MSETSHVLQEFVSVHHDTIKESNLEKLVSQYQELSANVDDMRADLGYIGEALAGGDHDNEEDLEAELRDFLCEGSSSSEQLVPPSRQFATKDETPQENKEAGSFSREDAAASAVDLPSPPETTEVVETIKPVASYFATPAL